MPKILVVFYSGDDASGAIADAVAAGAESVRFAEVDVRCVGEAPPHVMASKSPRRIASTEELAPYDAVVIGGPADGTVPAELAELLRAAASGAAGGTFADKVGSAFTTSVVRSGELPAASLMTSLASLGMILIPSVGESERGTLLDRARAMGQRVAQVTGWVAHSLGHERSHGHHHEGHGHTHGNTQSRAHAHDHERRGAHDHDHEHGHSHGQAHRHGDGHGH